MIKCSKILTATDVGKTNAHLSGIRIPNDVIGTNVLPCMPTDILNPTRELTFFDENGIAWTFNYKYYNDKYHGKPQKKAHNEYRLTCVKDYIREYMLEEGDEVWFSMDDKKVRHIGFVKKEKVSEPKNDDGIIHVKGGWKVYDF